MNAQSLEKMLDQPLGLLVHIGAGEGELADLPFKADRVVMIEPDPERFSRLSARLGSDPCIDLVHAAVVDQAGLIDYHRASLGRFGAPRRITGARRLFRGLRDIGTVSVQGVTLPETIGDLEPSKPLLVLIDTASDALVALNQLREGSLLTKGCRVVVKVAEIALHEGGADRKSLEAWASRNNYQLERLPDENDPDIWLGELVSTANRSPTLEAAKPVRPSELDVLKQQLLAQKKLVQKHRNRANRAEKKLEKANQKLSDAVKEVAEVKPAYTKLLAEHGKTVSELEQLRKEHHSQTKDLQRQLAQSEQRAKELAAAKKNLDEKVSAMEGAVRSRQEKISQLEKQLGDLDAQKKSEAEANSLTKSKLCAEIEKNELLAQNVGDLEEKVKKIDGLQDTVNSLKERLNDKASELERTLEERELTLRTQNMAQADLRDLKEQYADLVQERDELQELLAKLLNRLYSAADAVEELRWSGDVGVDKTDEAKTESRTR